MSADDCPKCKEHPVDCSCASDCQSRQSVHPWQAFLNARADVIDWMKQNGDHDHLIAHKLSMSVQQVYLIRTRNRALDLRERKKVDENSKEPDWREVAMRFGEEFSSVGPDFYYQFTPEQWLKYVKERLDLMMPDRSIEELNALDRKNLESKNEL